MERVMDVTYLIVVLAMGNLLAGLVFSIVSKARIEKRMDDPNAPKSKLAVDANSTGKAVDV